MKKNILLTVAVAALCAVRADAASTVVLNFGTGELNAGSIGATFPSGGGEQWLFTVDDSTANVTGMPAGVSFQVLVTTLADGVFSSQTNAIGLDGAADTAAAGLDNGTNDDPIDEGFEFSIGNVTGLGGGESMYISGLSLTFLSATAGDSWEINSDGVVTASGSADVLVTPNDQALIASIFARSNPSSTDDRGTGNNNTRFGIAAMEITIVPEPSSVMLGAAAGLMLCFRRRR
ncbi:hypothetical protein [Oceaniferula spumae]